MRRDESRKEAIIGRSSSIGKERNEYKCPEHYNKIGNNNNYTWHTQESVEEIM